MAVVTMCFLPVCSAYSCIPKMMVLLLSVEPLVNMSSDGSISSTDAIDALDSLTSF